MRESDYMNTTAAREYEVETDTKPFFSSMSRLDNQIQSVHKSIERIYSRLDHLICDNQGPDDIEALKMARLSHSDTVSRLEALADHVQNADERLLHLLRILEA